MSLGKKADPSRELELQHLYERAPIALCVTDRDHRYVRINQRLGDINGRPVEEHLGRTVREVIPHLADQLVPMFQGIIDTGEPVLEYEVQGETLKHPGEERIFVGAHFPLISTSGEVQYVHTMVRDVTDQRRAEAEMNASNAHLEEQVKVHTAELLSLSGELKAEAAQRVRAQEEASRNHSELAHMTRVRSMGELAASISHELNQPLAAVLTNAQAALRLLDGKKPDLEELREILGDIVSDDKRAGQVIRRLRTLLQKEPVAHETVRIDELVSGVLPMVRSDALGANVKITVESVPDLPLVEVDPVQIQQVVMNLLVNAIDATRGRNLPGGEINVQLSHSGKDGLRITVADNGVGIPPDNIRDIFKPFVTSKSGGLGMGLAICKSILEAHGGTISVERSTTEGCRFSLRLPLKQQGVS